MDAGAREDSGPSQTIRDDEEEAWADALEENGGEAIDAPETSQASTTSQNGGEVNDLQIGAQGRVASREGDVGSVRNQEVARSDIAIAGNRSSRSSSAAATRRQEIRNGKAVQDVQPSESTVEGQSAREVYATVELLTNAASLVKACANTAAPRDFLLKTAAVVLQKALQGIQAAQSDMDGEGNGAPNAEQHLLHHNPPRLQLDYLLRHGTGQPGPSMPPPVDDGENAFDAPSNDHMTYEHSDEEEEYDEEYDDEDHEDEEYEEYEDEESENEEIIPPSVDMPPGMSGENAPQPAERRKRTPQIKKELDQRFDQCPIVRMLDTEMNRESGHAITAITAYYERLPEINRNDVARNEAPVDTVLVEEHQEEEHQEEERQRERQQDQPEQPADTTEQQAQKPAVALKIGSPILLDVLASVLKFEIPQPCVLYPPYKPLLHHWGLLTSKLEQLKTFYNTHLALIEAEDEAKRKARLLDKQKAKEALANSDGQDVASIDDTPERADDCSSIQSDDTLFDPNENKRSTLHLIQRTFIHLQTFVDLIRAEAPTAVDVREKLLAGTLQCVGFEDLWQLYNIGDVLIYRHNGHELACQVFSVTGGRRGNTSLSTAPSEAVFAGYDRGADRGDDVAGLVSSLGSPEARDAIPQYPSALVRYSPSAYQGFRPGSFGDRRYEEQDETYTPFIIDCFFMDFDGTYIGPCNLPLDIPYYAGEREIKSLDIYPVAFHDPDDDIMARLSARGRQFMGCAGHRTYDGWTLSGHEDMQGQMFIDFKTGYRQIGWPANRPEFGRLFRHVVAGPSLNMTDWHKKTLSDERFNSVLSNQFIHGRKRELWKFVKPDENVVPDETYALMSYVMLGYAFQQRRWYYLDVDHIGEIDKSDAARGSGWEDLVIPTAYREMLVALVESHASGSTKRSSRNNRPALSTQMDLVRGKGHGLIILLHGPPGSGKTSTAETIAAYTKRPLYSITCGDIGSTAQEIEKNLQKHFELANQWGCVLLLDEADVFLTKRNWHDINRNSLVSIWLRILEYYSGILFITTNRIGVIDEAFKSRIHVCLRYPSLDEVSTRLVWEKLLNRIERDNSSQSVKIVLDRDELLAFAERHYRRHAHTNTTWNGRQIRNAFQTAIALGQYERLRKLRRKGWSEEEAERSGKEKYMQVRLCKENFAKIAGTAADFENYLTSVRGSDGTAARNESVRDDEYGAQSGPRPVKKYGDLPAVRARGGGVSGWSQPQLQGFGDGSSIGGTSGMGLGLSRDGGCDESEDGVKEQESDSDSDGNIEW